jgi:hypothetical protein
MQVLSCDKCNSDNFYPLLISCFGFICSVAWSLANRGSKYWQENWENIIVHIENGNKEIGFLFSRVQPEGIKIKQEKSYKYLELWLKKRQFSVSKLSIAISDVLIIIWLLIIFKHTEVFNYFDKINYAVLFVVLIFVVLMIFTTAGTKNTSFKDDELYKGHKPKNNH